MNTVIVFDHPYTEAAHENIPHHRSFSAAICHELACKLEEKGGSVHLIKMKKTTKPWPQH